MSYPLIRTARLVTAYRRYLNQGDSLEFVSDIDPYYSTETLQRLLEKGDVESRRASGLVLGMMGDRRTIESLGRALSDSDRGVRLASDDSFRTLLRRDAAQVHYHQLLHTLHLIDGQNFEAALPDLIILCDRAPMYAEAHYVLALCWVGLGELSAAKRAYSACVWRCRYHYLSWMGLSQISLDNNDPSNALKFANRAIEINPDLEWARLTVRRLRQSSDHRL